MSSDHLKDKRRDKVISASLAWSVINDRKKLWRERTFRQEPFQGNEMTAYGLEHECYALSAFEKSVNDICKSGNQFHVHGSDPIGASADGFYYDQDLKIDIPIELKCPWSQEIYPEIPQRYWYQVQIQTYVHGTPYGWFGVWTPDEFKAEKIDHDPEFIEWFLPYAYEFLKFVDEDKEPPRWNKKPIYQPKKN